MFAWLSFSKYSFYVVNDDGVLDKGLFLKSQREELAHITFTSFISITAFLSHNEVCNYCLKTKIFIHMNTLKTHCKDVSCM